MQTCPVPCPVCGSRDCADFAVSREHEFEPLLGVEVAIVQCQACGMIYINPQPAACELARLYPPQYCCHEDSAKQDSRTWLGRIKRMVNNAIGQPSVAAHIARGLILPSHPKILDIGCGAGCMLDAFHAVLPEAETHGVDFSPKATAIASAKGHHVVTHLIEDVDYPSQFFDIIYTSNVIEHIGCPAIIFEKSMKWIKPDGVLICETPDISGLDGLLFAKSGYWGGYHAPRHWSFFTESTLCRLAEKYGFIRKKCKHFPAPIFWLWTFHHILYRYSGSKRFADVCMPIFETKWNLPFSIFLKAFWTGIDILTSIPWHTSIISVTFSKGEDGKK